MTAFTCETAIRIALLVLPNFNALAATALIDPFRAANYLRGPEADPSSLYSWSTLTLGDGSTPQPVAASNGFNVIATPISNLGETTFDAVFVCASWAPERYRDPTLYAWLRRQAGLGAALGGIDTGAFVLGYAGLLDGYEATVHYEHLEAFEELFPKVKVSNALYVVDRSRLTGCGGVASGDLALHLVRHRFGASLANAVSRYIFHDRLRPASEAQVSSLEEPLGYSLPERLRRALSLMEAHLEEPLPIGDIAAAADLSQRQLLRLFRDYTGVTPLRYYLDRRLDRARGMITQTDLSVLEIALACGFSNPEYMTRCYRQRFSVTPSDDRVLGRVPYHFRSFPNYAWRGPAKREKS